MSTPHIMSKVSPEFKARVTKAAATINQSESKLICAALTEWLERHNTPAKMIDSLMAHHRRQLVGASK